jgi:ABC-type nitrate/sulfonate/bicarbonate transport system substrate-binding protein
MREEYMNRRLLRGRRLLGAALLASVGLLAACGSDDSGSQTSPETQAPAETTAEVDETTGATDAPETISVTMAVDGFTLGTPVWVGIEKGYFAAEGLDVSPVTFQTGFESIQALPAGEVDFAWGLDFAAVSSSSERLSIIGSVATPLPGFHKMVFNQSVTTPEELVGKKIGVLEGTAQAYVSQLWVNDLGIADQVELVPLPGAFEIVAALKTDEIQASFLFGASMQEVTPESGLTVFGDDSAVIEIQGIYLITTSEFLSENEEAARRVLKALVAITQDMAADPQGAADITAAAINGDPAALLPSITNGSPFLGFTAQKRDYLAQIEEFLKEAGKIPAETDVVSTIKLDLLREVAPDNVDF